MRRKEILAFISRQDTIGRLEEICSTLDVDIAYFDLGKIDNHDFSDMLECDLIMFELGNSSLAAINGVEDKLLEKEGLAYFYVINSDDLDQIASKTQQKYDFVVVDAIDAEIKARISKLLWPGSGEEEQEILKANRMEVNLSTYQVSIDGTPLDLTYLEYKLLVFLMEHPGKTYSREELLKRVWGFDYYGGSRTVDVHVRRLRAKLGPDCARDLMTVRGVGYYWRAE